MNNFVKAVQCGVQTCIYWLPYVPDQFRFHFNGHNLIVYGRDGDDYLVSDPLFEKTTRCPRDAMTKARFAKGALQAKGLMYYPTAVPREIDLKSIIPKAIRANYKYMMQPLLPMIGIKGIRFVGKKIVELDKAQRSRSLPAALSHPYRAHAGRNRQRRRWVPFPVCLLPAGGCAYHGR